MSSLLKIIACFIALAGFLSVSAHARLRTDEENENLCGRFGETMARKFASNPGELVKELDELIVQVGSLGPNRVIHNQPGRKLASLSETPRSPEVRRHIDQKEKASLSVRVHKKLTEANKLITQTKKPGFADEDEERATGVQEACARVIYERASTLEKMTRENTW